MKKIVALIFASALILTGCSSTNSASNSDTSKDAKATNLSAADFAGAILENNVETIDVRTPSEFLAGHISGAINIDVENANFESEIAKLDKAKVYAVYCHSGRRSQIAIDKMSAAGFKNLYNLENGIADWIARGWPVVTS